MAATTGPLANLPPPGASVRGRSESGRWYNCTVAKHGMQPGLLLLHFEGFDSKYGEWIDVSQEPHRIKEHTLSPVALANLSPAAGDGDGDGAAAISSRTPAPPDESALLSGLLKGAETTEQLESVVSAYIRALEATPHDYELQRGCCCAEEALLLAHARSDAARPREDAVDLDSMDGFFDSSTSSSEAPAWWRALDGCQTRWLPTIGWSTSAPSIVERLDIVGSVEHAGDGFLGSGSYMGHIIEYVVTTPSYGPAAEFSPTDFQDDSAAAAQAQRRPGQTRQRIHFRVERRYSDFEVLQSQVLALLASARALSSKESTGQQKLSRLHELKQREDQSMVAERARWNLGHVAPTAEQVRQHKVELAARDKFFAANSTSLRMLDSDHRNLGATCPIALEAALVGLPPFPGKSFLGLGLNRNVEERRRELEAWLRQLSFLQHVTLTTKGKRRVARILADFLQP